MSLPHQNDLPTSLSIDVDGTLDLSAYFTNVPLDRFVVIPTMDTDVMAWGEPERAPSRENTPTLPMPAVLRSTLLAS